MNALDDELGALVIAVQAAWVVRLAIPGDDAFPVLRLPTEHLRFAKERGYVLSFAVARRFGAVELLVDVSSFDLDEGPGDWAIPCAYTPTTDTQRLRQALGFDEGWELADLECVLACDASTSEFWRAALERGRLGLTASGAGTLFPVRIGPRDREPLEAFTACSTP